MLVAIPRLKTPGFHNIYLFIWEWCRHSFGFLSTDKSEKMSLNIKLMHTLKYVYKNEKFDI